MFIAAATALATGEKNDELCNRNGCGKESRVKIPGTPTESKGNKIGIITSASIDHATPGGFYASQPDRSMYYEIGVDAANSVSISWWADCSNLAASVTFRRLRLYDLFNQKGYTMFRGMDAYNRAAARIKFSSSQPITVSKSHEYAMDRSAKDLSLPDFTKACLAIFRNREEGFLYDGRRRKNRLGGPCPRRGAVVKESIDFDQCIRLAYDFYKKHPNGH